MPAFPVVITGQHMLATAVLLSALAMAADAQVPAPPAPAAAPSAAYAPYAAAAPRASRPATHAVTRLPSEATLQGDPADSLYRSARSALQRGQFREAADAMRLLRSRHAKSGYVADSYYWEAYALSRVGGSAELRRATSSLDEQASRYPNAATRGDARTLRAELMARLARQGDATAAEDLTRTAMGAVAPPAPPAVPNTPSAARAPRAPSPPRPEARGQGRSGTDECGEEDDVQAAALNGLMQMDASRAMPVLKKVLARRDPGSECLRRRAVFIVSQQATDAAPILLETARTDPDAGVRGQAVFWLSQVDSEAAVAALDSILRQSKDPDVREKAIYALAQQESPRAAQSLRDFASSEQSVPELRDRAVFWIGQRDDAASRTFLRDLYRKTTSPEMKEKILFSVAQSDDPQARPWLLGVVRDPKESMEARKRALFLLGQQGATAAELGTLWNQLTEPELREQLVFALAQSDDPAAIDRLIEIARSDKDRELRKKAIFWLGQSDDPRAADVLAKILTGDK
jgi:HEAT repeat protein